MLAWPGPGAGPIRLACRSQCPVSWHQMHLWDRSLAPGKNDLVLVRDAAKRNALGLLVEEDAPVVLGERLQVAAEDRWQAPDPARDEADKQAEQKEQEHRLKTAQLIKQQRLRISTLGKQVRRRSWRASNWLARSASGAEGRDPQSAPGAAAAGGTEQQPKAQLGCPGRQHAADPRRVGQTAARSGTPWPHRGRYPALPVRLLSCGRELPPRWLRPASRWRSATSSWPTVPERETQLQQELERLRA